MMGRGKSAVENATDTAKDMLGDAQTGATAGAVKEAALGALSALGAKAAEVAQGAAGNKMLAQAADSAGKQVEAARKKVDVDGKGAAAGQLLQLLSKRAGEATQNATSGAVNIRIDPNDVPRMLRGLALVATGLGTLFAPGSSLDASGSESDGHEVTEQARQGIEAAMGMTQQRIKDLVDVAKDTLASLSDALTEGIEDVEQKAQHALDEAETRLTHATDQVADRAKQALPEPRRKGGSLRWLMAGAMAGGLVGYLSSPLSGQMGERIANLRRDLGLGGDADDDSQYWPSPPQDASTATGDAADDTASGNAEGAQASTAFNKTENWKDSGSAKENSDKS